MRGAAFIAACALAFVSGAAPARAEEAASPWVAQITPYIWGAGIGGTIRPFTGGPTLDLDKSFFDVLEDLDAALFVSGFARRERFVALGDFSHVRSSRSGAAAVPGVGSVPARGSLRQTSLTLAGGYRVVEGPEASLDLLGGLRAWWIRGDVNVGGAVSRSGALDFVDPIIAARVNLGLAPGWSAIAYGDVGGFGAGSELTWQALATVNYQLSDSAFVSLGYRHLSFDYRTGGGARADVSLSGPLLGATLRF